MLGALVGTAYGCLVAPWIPQALRSLGSSDGPALLGLAVTAAWSKLPIFASVGCITHAFRSRSASVQISGVAVAVGLGDWTIGRWSLGIPWGLLGHSQLAVPGVAQLAVVGGVPLLSGWLAAINTAAALVVGGNRPALRALVALAGAWLAAAGLGLPLAERIRPSDRGGAGVELLVVQPELPRDARWEERAQAWILAAVASQTSEALSSRDGRVDAIVWPENLLTTPLQSDPELSRALQGHVDQWGVPLVSGLVRSALTRAPSTYRSSVVWIEPGRGIASAIDKFRAVPVLESSRTVAEPLHLAALFGRAARWPKVEEAAGPGSSLRAGFSATPVLCYEVLFPDIVAQRRSPESLAILNLADDSWVSGATATRQLADFAAFRAIEQRLTLVRVAHGGLTRVVDPFGRTRLELPLDRPSHASVTISRSAPPTPIEKAALFALPLSTGSGVGWGLALMGRRARASRGANAPGETRP